MKVSICWLDRVETPIPRGYGLAYTEYDVATEVFYPIPINYVVRYALKYYWRFLRFFYRVGLIDVGEAETFSWRDFYRIKAH